MCRVCTICSKRLLLLSCHVAIISWAHQRVDAKAPTSVRWCDNIFHRTLTVMTYPSAATVKKGGKAHHLHLQCMLWCPKLNPNRDAVQQAAHDMVYNFAGVPKGQNYHVYVELHWPGNATHVTWRTMLGYFINDNSCTTAVAHFFGNAVQRCMSYGFTSLMSSQWQIEQEVSRPDSTFSFRRYVMKDKGQEHWKLPFICGACNLTFLHQCLDDYQAVSLWKWKPQGALQPDKFMMHDITFERKHLKPLDIHPVQVVRLMLLDGFFIIGEKWCKLGMSSVLHDFFMASMTTYLQLAMNSNMFLPACNHCSFVMYMNSTIGCYIPMF
jgi:hypothetical protein